MPRILDLRFWILDVGKQSNLQSKIYNLKSTKGFTLIEVILAAFFFIALITILLSSSGTLLNTRKTNLETVAAKIATKRIENLRNTAFDSLPGQGTSTFTDSDLSKLPQGSASQTTYNHLSDTEIKDVLITVLWTENGALKQLKMQTLITRYGL